MPKPPIPARGVNKAIEKLQSGILVSNAIQSFNQNSSNLSGIAKKTLDDSWAHGLQQYRTVGNNITAQANNASKLLKAELELQKSNFNDFFLKLQKTTEAPSEYAKQQTAEFCKYVNEQMQINFRQHLADYSKFLAEDHAKSMGVKLKGVTNPEHIKDMAIRAVARAGLYGDNALYLAVSAIARGEGNPANVAANMGKLYLRFHAKCMALEQLGINVPGSPTAVLDFMKDGIQEIAAALKHRLPEGSKFEILDADTPESIALKFNAIKDLPDFKQACNDLGVAAVETLMKFVISYNMACNARDEATVNNDGSPKLEEAITMAMTSMTEVVSNIYENGSKVAEAAKNVSQNLFAPEGRAVNPNSPPQAPRQN